MLLFLQEINNTILFHMNLLIYYIRIYVQCQFFDIFKELIYYANRELDV